MALRTALAEVLSHQPFYSSANTERMQRRGQIVRRDIPQIIEPLRSSLAAAAHLAESDVLVEGRDGTGLKSEVPWIRFASRELSPSATTGWYVVWLHKGDGSGVYLTLAHGSTQFVSGALVARSDAELARLMAWARSVLSSEIAQHPSLMLDVNLRTERPLAAAYEKSSVAAFYYPRDSIPADAALSDDMVFMARLLGKLYRAERLGQTPLSGSPEIRDAEEAGTAIARPSTSSYGQGFALTAPERRAVELHAMAVATRHLVALGFSVKDVSARQPFDLQATLEQEEIKVEVKGTTGPLGTILLTRGEVELHRAAHPRNALIVVHSISLATVLGKPVASGGHLQFWRPWRIEDDQLKGVTFAYKL